MRQFVLREKSQCRALYAYLRHNWTAMAAQGKPLAAAYAERKTCLDRAHEETTATQSQDDFDAELNDTAP